MRILAIETTGRSGSIAVLEGSGATAQRLGETRLTGGRTAQILAPAMQTLLSNMGWPASSVELVGVAVGPGSFTGLRIGVTTAKTFAYAVGAQVIGVDTMDALAAQAPPAAALLWTIVDAQRQELFVARFSTTAGQAQQREATRIIAQEVWLSQLRPGDRVVGPPLARLMERLPEGVVVLPESDWHPSAAAVGQAAWQRFQRGERDDIWTLAPKYLRLSAAEEKQTRRLGDKETRRI